MYFSVWIVKFWNTFVVIESNSNNVKYYKEQEIRHGPLWQLDNCSFIFHVYSNILIIQINCMQK